MLYTLVYTSKAAPNFGKPTLDNILESSILNNAVNSITGILLYNNRDFLQVLEGEKGNVLALFERIKEDPRHEFILKVMEGNITHRQFPNWIMAARQLDNTNYIEDVIPANSKSPVSVLIRKYLLS